MQRSVDAIDGHIGARVRIRRRLKGLSQEYLAERLGISFQQIQKYENGRNRISAKRLFQIADILQAPIGYFYEGLKAVEDAIMPGFREDEPEAALSLLTTSEGIALIRSFSRIQAQGVRKEVLSLVAALARQDQTEPEEPESTNRTELAYNR